MIIKFLHWNIWFHEKIENILSLIKSVNPDIICLNELSEGLDYNKQLDTADYLSKKLGYYFVSEKYMDWQNDGKMLVLNGIFSRFPILKKFSHYTQKIKLDKSYKNYKGTVYLEAEVKINNRAMTFATDHLSYLSKFQETREKKAEIDELIKIIKNKKTNYIFSGDLNSPPITNCINRIQKYLNHCGPGFNQNSAFTKKLVDYNGWVTGFEWRLDYVFASKDLQIRKSEILKTDFSDHLPIFVRINI